MQGRNMSDTAHTEREGEGERESQNIKFPLSETAVSSPSLDTHIASKKKSYHFQLLFPILPRVPPMLNPSTPLLLFSRSCK